MSMMLRRNKKLREKVRAKAKIANEQAFAPEPEVKAEYSKTEINRMSTADLQVLADRIGIENATELSGADLKKILIEKFGL